MSLFLCVCVRMCVMCVCVCVRVCVIFVCLCVCVCMCVYGIFYPSATKSGNCILTCTLYPVIFQFEIFGVVSD